MIIEIDLMDDLLDNTSYSSNIQVLISEWGITSLLYR
jgi:hypothetical protein